jgi:glyceraldehyde 3-phosphate dehydrogenase
VFRALWGRPDLELAHVNDPGGDAAHLLSLDSLHGRLAADGIGWR